MKINHFGTLYIVATPIGNLKDMSPRAIEILQMVDSIAAEDTRYSGALLQHFFIKTPVFALHEHNERERASLLLKQLQEGKSIALISDAGTPLISDPGYFLVREARQAGITVVPIPGPCAAIVALSVAGLPTDRFVFEGFLPAKSKQRLQQLEKLRDETRTIIFYEAPHRILDLIEDMQKIFEETRIVVIARELTKRFETIYSDTLINVKRWIENDTNQQRGEIVVLVEGAKEIPAEKNQAATQALLTILLETLPLKQAVEIAAKITGERKNDLYQQALEMKKSN